MVVHKNRFFKITTTDGKSLVVISHKGWYGITDIIGGVQDKDHTYVTPISLLEVIWYILKRKAGDTHGQSNR